MKKLIVFTVVISSVLMLNMVSHAGPILIFKLEFGKKSCDCCGFGICDFEIGLELNNDYSSKLGDGESLGEVRFDGKILIMNFFKESMTGYTKNKYFGSEFFIIEEDFVLPMELCKKLDLNSFTIKRGRYMITENSKQFTVSFK